MPFASFSARCFFPSHVAANMALSRDVDRHLYHHRRTRDWRLPHQSGTWDPCSLCGWKEDGIAQLSREMVPIAAKHLGKSLYIDTIRLCEWCRRIFEEREPGNQKCDMCGIRGPSYDVHLVDLGLTSCRPCHKYCMGWIMCGECGWWDNTKHMAKRVRKERFDDESGLCNSCLDKKRAESVARMKRERADREESVRTYKRLYLNGGLPCASDAQSTIATAPAKRRRKQPCAG